MGKKASTVREKKKVTDTVTFDNILFEKLKSTIEKEKKEIIFAKKKKYFDREKNRMSERENIDINGFIQTTLIRINDTCKHLISIQTRVKNEPFVFYDFMTCSETLISCMLRLAEQFEADTAEFENSKKVFIRDFQIGKDYSECSEKHKKCKSKCKEIDSDWNYFKYLRSLCGIHPTETTYHCRYMDNTEEWCPYVEIPTRSFIYGTDYEYPDYNAEVWTSNSNSRSIKIFISQIFDFVSNAYSDLMNLMIDSIEKYYTNKLEELMKKHIPRFEECSNDDEYLNGMKNAISERCGMSLNYFTIHWKRILRTEFSDPMMNSLLKEYKKSVINDIEEKRDLLQSMEMTDYWDFYNLPTSESIPCNQLYNYPYECEKIENYLHRTEEDSKDISEFDDQIRFDSYYLDKDDYAEIQNKHNNELPDLKDNQLAVYYGKNSGWARVQLKKIESIFGNGIAFDYGASNWSLYMQYHVARWNLHRITQNQISPQKTEAK